MDTFADYWRSLSAADKLALASKAGTSSNYLSQVASGHRAAGISLITRLTAAEPKITARMLRPDLYRSECGAAA